MAVVDGGVTSTSWRPLPVQPPAAPTSERQEPVPVTPPASRPFADAVTLTTRPPAAGASDGAAADDPGAGPESFAAQVTRVAAAGRGSASGGLSVDVVV